MPGKHTLSVYRGDTRRWQFALWADADKTQPTDLTGVTVQAQIQTSTSVVSLVCSVTLPNLVNMTLNAPESKSLVPGKGVWDLQLTYPTGDVATVIGGDVMITADVTIVGAST